MDRFGQTNGAREVDAVLEDRGLRDTLALDIDETLSTTTTFWFKALFERFGGAEEDARTPEELRRKYRYTWDVPGWNNTEAREWMDKARRDNGIAGKIGVVSGAVDAVIDIHENVMPVGLYVTARYESIRQGTQAWLDMQGFPPGLLIMKPERLSVESSNAWKASILREIKRAKGIFDDNKALVNALENLGGYHGFVGVFQDVYTGPETSFSVFSVDNWSNAREAITRNSLV